MADYPASLHPLTPSKFEQSLYLEIPPDEERIFQRKPIPQYQYLKYGLILICLALLGSWLTWLTLRTGKDKGLLRFWFNLILAMFYV